MLLLLFRLRLRVITNTIKIRTLTSPALSGSAIEIIKLLLISILILGFMGMSFSFGIALFPFAYRTSGVTGLGSIVNSLFIGAFIATLFSSLTIAFYSLFTSADLPIWITAPIPLRVIFIEKFVEVLLGSSGFYVVLFLPSLIALGITLKAGIIFYLSLLLASLLFLSIPTGIGILLIMFFARFIKVRRMKEIIGVMGGVLGLAIYVGTQLLPSLVNKHNVQATEALKVLDNALIPFLPTDWISNILISVGLSKYPDAALQALLLLTSSLGIILLTLVATERIYYTGLANISDASSKKKKSKVKWGTGHWMFSSPIGSIAVKDAKCLLRNPQEWIQLLWPLAVVFIFMFRTNRGNSSFDTGGAEAIFSAFFLLFLMSMFAVRLSLTGVGRELKSIWIIHLAPIERSNIIIAKLIVAYIPSLILAELLYVILAFVQGFSLWASTIGMLSIVGVLLGINALGIMLGATYPKFDAKNPRELVQQQGGLLYMLMSLVYIGALGAAAAIPQLGRFIGVNPTILWVLSIIILYAAVGASTVLFVRAASKKLETLEITV